MRKRPAKLPGGLEASGAWNGKGSSAHEWLVAVAKSLPSLTYKEITRGYVDQIGRLVGV